MSTSQSDALVLFVAAGDQVFKDKGGNKSAYRVRSFNSKESRHE